MALSSPASTWKLRDQALNFGPPLAAGIVNVTDDSFYVGARSVTPQQAVADGLALADAGFDLIDVGAVPARSGPAVAPAQEAAKLVPAIEGLVRQARVPVSADTFSPDVASAAVKAGAQIINDIGGGAPEMLEAVSGLECGYVLMHIEGPPREDRPPPELEDPVEHLLRWFSGRIEQAVSRGIDEQRIAIDPGLDFDLGAGDGAEVLRRLGELHALGRPIFLAISRKDTLGAIAAGSWAQRLDAGERGPASAAATALAVAQGVQVVRLHDREALDALRVAAAIEGHPVKAPAHA